MFLLSLVLQYISTILSLNQGSVWTAQQQQKDKGLVVVGGVHSPEFEFEKNYTNVKNATQKGMTHPVIATGMIENHTITTIKLNATQFQQIDKSQFIKAPEFAQISGYINTPIIIVQLHFHLLKEK